MGYIEETGAAQHLRDARITAIYEGTTAIQANDLIGRKIAREKAVTIKAVMAEMRTVAGQLDDDLSVIGARLNVAVDALEKAVLWIVDHFAAEPKAVHAGAVPFLYLMGIVSGGWQLGRSALVARDQMRAGDSDPFWAAKLATARFFADHQLTQAAGLAQSVIEGHASLQAIPDECF